MHNRQRYVWIFRVSILHIYTFYTSNRSKVEICLIRVYLGSKWLATNYPRYAWLTSMFISKALRIGVISVELKSLEVTHITISLVKSADKCPWIPRLFLHFGYESGFTCLLTSRFLKWGSMKLPLHKWLNAQISLSNGFVDRIIMEFKLLWINFLCW